MFRTLTALSLALLLGFALVVPGTAETPDVAEEVTADAVLVDLELAEEPLMTPMERPEVLEIPGLGIPERVEKLRVCDPDEEAQCPSGCFCLIIRNAVNCYC